MVKFKIKNTEIQELLMGDTADFPKYTSQLINLANQNAQGTRPRVVGQMSDLIQEFPGRSVQEWESWYKQKQPDAIEEATKRIYQMIENLQQAVAKIDRDMVKAWVEELVIAKTFMGLRFQDAILKKVALDKGYDYRLAAPEEESKGIDGYIGDHPVSIKPITYKTKMSLMEEIGAYIIFYDKKKDGINVEYNF